MFLWKQVDRLISFSGDWHLHSGMRTEKRIRMDLSRPRSFVPGLLALFAQLSTALLRILSVPNNRQNKISYCGLFSERPVRFDLVGSRFGTRCVPNLQHCGPPSFDCLALKFPGEERDPAAQVSTIKTRLPVWILLGAILACGAAADPVTDDSPIDPAHPPAMEELHFSSGGARLNGILYRPGGVGMHATVVLLHGWAGNERNLDIGQALRRAGYNVLYFNYRGTWGSAGYFSFGNAVADTQAAIAYLRSNPVRTKWQIDPARILLFGHSAGGTIAWLTALSDPTIKGVVLVSAWNAGIDARAAGKSPAAGARFAEDNELLSSEKEEGAPLRIQNTERWLDDFIAHADELDLCRSATALRDRPLLLVAGRRDEDCPPVINHEPLMRALRSAGATQTQELWFDDDHPYSGHRIALSRAVVAWVLKVTPP
jgi:pimeloyl-ACP methyl ester carboxylesterase